ncbi:Catechol-2,3-dioxygenase [Thermomonospora echinospora]|uniref:Catechol-2,3-dioxygenase n=1 Tax=Thermomonospora echinospora TaxID=1992 RepID=A0A1H6E3J9_9ACTN|nr:VOC family protein [Thermomonospora echinospora]SEG91921.1 Catechol-2,3-dioxygenase [Thermomonospora echinospora]
MSECRITHVRYVGLGVRSFDRQVGFYQDLWGLVAEQSESGVSYLAAAGSTDPYSLRLRKAGEDRVDVVSFAVPTAADVDWYAERLIARRVRMISGPASLDTAGGGYGMRFHDPDGRTVEIAAGLTPRMAREVAEREHVPTGLSHVVLNSPDLPATTRWYVEVLGFAITDYLEDVMVFLKSATDFHHCLALAQGPHVSLNHVAYETRGLDEYLRATGSMMRAGGDLVWGPGRHGPGDNTFAYFCDESGFVAEYTTALERIADFEAWAPRVWKRVPQESDQWGTACVRRPEPFVGRPDPGLWTPPPF